MTCQIGAFGVGARHGKTFRKKDLCQSAHTDTADPDKMHGNRMKKIQLIHKRYLPDLIILSLLYPLSGILQELFLADTRRLAG
jgi:hypothetical protein